jgi:hypothetical protein
VLDNDPASVTAPLERMRDGDAAARHAIVPIVCGDLRRLAASYLKRDI